MTTRIKVRHDTASNWAINNPVLALGEPGFELDTNRVKYGDGVTAWVSLPYSGAGADLNGDIDIGNMAGHCSQAPESIAIGNYAGQIAQEVHNVAIGQSAGANYQIGRAHV